MRIYSGCFSVVETATIHSVKPVITGYLLYKEDFLRYTIFSKLNVISILAYMDFRKEDDTVVMDYTKRIYMLTAISFFVGTSQFVIVGVLDKVAASLGVSLGTAGQLVTAFALANAVGAPLLMMGLSRWTNRKQLLLALGIVLLGIISTVISNLYGLLLLGRALLGIGSGVFVAASYTVAGLLAPPHKRAKAMADVSLGFSTALVFGVPIGRMLTEMYNWEAVFWLIGVFTVLGMLAVAKWIPANLSAKTASLTEQLSVFKQPYVIGTYVLTVLVFMGFSPVNTYIAPILTNILQGSSLSISTMLLIIGVASMVGSKLGGYLVTVFGVYRVLPAAVALQAVFLVVLWLLHGLLSAAVVSLALWSTFAWVFGITQSIHVSMIAPHASGVMLTVNSSVVQLGLAVGAMAGGYGMSLGSTNDLYILSIVFEVLAMLWGAYLVLRLKKTIDSPELAS